MSPLHLILTFVVTSLVAGLVGGAAMEGVIALIGRADWARGNMIIALGSMITNTRENAFRVGAIVHAISAVGFAAVYAMLMIMLETTTLPGSLMLGLGVGALHGLVVSLMLVWVVCESHPLPEFREAGFEVGLSHFAGHVAYGAVVGLIIGLSPL